MTGSRVSTTIAFAVVAAWSIHAQAAPPVATIDDLAMSVTATANRAVSFTNRRSAFYYTQTHRNDHPEHAWFRGFSIAGRRIFSDYRLSVAGSELDPATALSVEVRPDAMVRRYRSGVIETLRLYDDRDVVGVEVQGAAGPVELTIAGEMMRAAGAVGEDRYSLSVGDTPDAAAMIVVVRRVGTLFLACVAASRDAAGTACAEAAQHEPQWRAARHARLAQLINGSQYVLASDPALTRSLRWIALTMDQLITRQRGDGIYAGLPWFPEYWGRDSFIALPGAALVTGRFEEARAILASFAEFQDLDPASRFFGRMPNIVKPGSLDYHTTDGTPRWVLALRDYVRYTGDFTLLRELYPNVVASIEGSLSRFTDERGLLVHADNETWMDARRVGDLAAYAPRGTRANDIQALWYGQLRAGAEFAERLGDPAAARRWTAAAEQVQLGFNQLFVVEPAERRSWSMADHVTAEGVADHTLRPNGLFALDLLPEPAAAAITAHAWRTLVLPWGVATLDPSDRGFHPYHLAPGCWHKDAAYHNGTVWPWLDGIAIDRMIEFGHGEPAWALFLARSRLALERGVVGGLPETLDAYARPGESEPRLTGTYLQAWSNSEHLRAWYQDFLGVRPSLDQGAVRVAPRLPASFGDVDFTARVGSGTLRGVYERQGPGRRYRWAVSGLDTMLVVDLPQYATQSLRVRDGEQVVVEDRPGGAVVRQYAADGQVKQEIPLQGSAERTRQQQDWDAIFAGTTFAAPRPVGEPAMRCVTPSQQ